MLLIRNLQHSDKSLCRDTDLFLNVEWYSLPNNTVELIKRMKSLQAHTSTHLVFLMLEVSWTHWHLEIHFTICTKNEITLRLHKADYRRGFQNAHSSELWKKNVASQSIALHRVSDLWKKNPLVKSVWLGGMICTVSALWEILVNHPKSWFPAVFFFPFGFWQMPNPRVSNFLKNTCRLGILAKKNWALRWNLLQIGL